MKHRASTVQDEDGDIDTVRFVAALHYVGVSPFVKYTGVMKYRLALDAGIAGESLTLA